MSVMPNPLSSPDASIGLSSGLGHHSLRRPAHYPPLRQLPIPLPGLATPLAARSVPLSTAPARPLRVSVKALTAPSPSGVGKVEFYTGDLPRIIWLERNFWGRSQDYFSTTSTPRFFSLCNNLKINTLRNHQKRTVEVASVPSEKLFPQRSR